MAANLAQTHSFQISDRKLGQGIKGGIVLLAFPCRRKRS